MARAAFLAALNADDTQAALDSLAQLEACCFTTTSKYAAAMAALGADSRDRVYDRVAVAAAYAKSFARAERVRAKRHELAACEAHLVAELLQIAQQASAAAAAAEFKPVSDARAVPQPPTLSRAEGAAPKRQRSV